MSKRIIVQCPKCSENAEKIDYMGAKCIVCNSCGYDECEQLEVYPDERSKQREKAKFSPYRAGGGRRAK